MNLPTLEDKNAVMPGVIFGNSEMGQRIREYDWAQTPLGPIDSWSQNLRTTVSIILFNRFPMLLWWGEDYISIYNDAYIPVLGTKHPWGLGKPVRECWSEIWHVLQPLIDTPFYQMQSTWMEDIQLQLNRYGFMEETHFTVAYSPVPDDSSKTSIGGVLATVHEITEKILNERALATIRELGMVGLEEKSLDSIYRKVVTAIKKNDKDFPFALVYKLTDDEKNITVAATAGIDFENPIFPVTIDLGNPNDQTREICEAYQMNKLTLGEIHQGLKKLPKGYWDIAPLRFACIPISTAGNKHPHAIILVALNPYRKFDAAYEQFCHSIGDRISLEVNKMLALEEERKRAEGLAEIDRAKTVFFSNISHEFRTPLTLLLGPIDDALNDPLTHAENKIRLDIAHRNAFRLLNLVNTLLDFSRIEAGRMQASFECVELGRFSAELASTFRSAIERAGMQLKVEYDNEVEAWVDIDMWEKIVLNLLSNAFKYTHTGSITVRLDKYDGHAELSISDTGIGIPENELSNVFARFYRVQNTGGRSQEGTGIGLALVQELVKLHHATINVKSKMGVGTTFTITLPLGKTHLPVQQVKEKKATASVSPKADMYLEEALKWLPSEQSIHEERLSSGKGITKKPKVLLADDNADVRDYVSRLLSDTYEVTAVANGKLALEAMKQIIPDLIVSDVMMPEMDGFELVAHLKELPKTRQIPVILLSAKAGEEATIHGLNAGADDYLVKPFSAKELLSRIDSNIKIAQTRTGAFRQMHKIFMDAPVAIAILRGKEFRFELANQSYLDITGKEEVLGKTLEEAFPEFTGDVFRDLLEEVYTTGIPYIGSEFEVELIRKGKKEALFFNFVYSPLHEADETISGIVVVATDVTQMVKARKMLEQNEARLEKEVTERTMELRETNEALKRSNKELEQFAFVTSHDLQEPLRKVRTFATLILDRNKEKLDEKSIYHIDKIILASQRMSKFINDLLHFSRLTLFGSFIPVDLNEIFKNVLIDFELTSQEKGAVIEITQLPTIDAIPLQMTQLFSNLLGNALKFSSEARKPSIRIVSRPLSEKDAEHYGLPKRPGGYCKFIFADNGIGFDQTYAQKIFEIFQRLNDRGAYEGTGVGLALCSRIVANHQGLIYADAEENKGATFHIILPIKHQKE